MKSFNLYGDEWDETRDREGWRIKEAFIGHHIGGAPIGTSMSEVQPGKAVTGSRSPSRRRPRLA
jgi:hypothetical protein